MPTWPADHLNLLGPAYIAFDGKGRGEIAFAALQATLECATTPEGWVELQDDRSLIGEFAYDNGDESDLRAVPR